MTNREFYQAVIDGALTDEHVEYATAAIEKLDATNAKRKEKTAEKAVEREAERAPLRDALVAVLTKEFQTATSLIAAAGIDVTPQKVPSLLKGLIADGAVLKGEVKVAGKGKHVGYALGEAEVEVEAAAE